MLARATTQTRRKMETLATRTAPLFTATANLRDVTIHLIDASGDLWSDEMSVPVGQAASTIETWIAAYQAATQCSIYKVSDLLVRSGAPLRANADAGFRAGGEMGINMTYKNFTTNETLPARLVGPIGDVMEGNTDTPDIAATQFTDLRDAVLAIKTGFVLASAQFTAHRERKNNTKVKG